MNIVALGLIFLMRFREYRLIYLRMGLVDSLLIVIEYPYIVVRYYPKILVIDNNLMSLNNR